MKSKLIPIALICVSAGLVRADFIPIALTSSSYTYAIVVPSNTVQALPYCLTADTGSGTAFSDTSFFEQGYYALPGQIGNNYGIPAHNTTFTASNNAHITFQMPPDYTSNNDLQVDANTSPSGTLTFASATTATNLAILCTGTAGGTTISYMVTHSDNSTESGPLSLPDWFNGGSTVAWGSDARADHNGNFQVISDTSQNNGAPYLYCYNIQVTNDVPIVSIQFNYVSGGEGNFYAVSVNASGANWTPIAVSGFNQITTIPATIPFPVTATMDNGTNIDNPGNTWFEQGYYRANTSYGLPPSGSIFSSFTQPTHQYQMGSYASNNAILIDTNHLNANITPALPTPYSAFAFLTAGGDIGTGNKMTNMCIMQHLDGVNETNMFYGYDWFESTVPGAIAYEANGRVYLNNRTLNSLGNQGFPYLFESYFTLSDTGSAVTNIIVRNLSVPSASSTTFIMAVSATAGGVAPVVIQGPLPAVQNWYPSQTATFSVQVSGTAPITNIWLVQSNGVYIPLTDGVDANGSTISGSSTTTLTISNLTLADSGFYEYEATNAIGGAISPEAILNVNSGTPVQPIIDSQTPPASVSTLNVFPNQSTLFSVVIDAGSAPPFTYQWYNGLPPSPATAIPNATNATYGNVDTANVSILVIVSNLAGTATSSPVTLNLVAPSTYQAAILAYHPVAYWPLNETSGNIAFDYTGSHEGTYVGGCTLGEAGIPANASIGATNFSVGFDGSSGYVDIPVGNLNITGPITVIAWIQTPVGGEAGNHFGTVLGHSDQSYRLSVVGNPPRFADPGPDAVGTANVGDGRWHQIIGVYDGTNQLVYADGQPTGPVSATSPGGGSSDDVWIAGAPDYAGQRNFNGNVADVAILTNALTASQVASVYASVDLLPVVQTDVLPLTAVPAGVPVTLSVTMLGTAPFYYQWSNGVSGAIQNATNSSYTFNALAGTNTYSVAISNAYASTISSTATVEGLTNPPPVLGFNTDGLNWTLNDGANITPNINNNVLTLTDGNDSEASSAFFDTVQYIGGFIASYTYTATGSGTLADGITFCLQNSTAGSNAVGSGGGDLGYTGIMPSAAFDMNIYPYGAGNVGIQLGIDGSTPDGNPLATAPSINTAPVNIASGDPIYVQLYYMQNVMNVALVDTTTGSSFTGSVPLTNLSAIVGGSSAFVGFTGGTGGASATQIISNFVYSYTTPPTLSLASGAAGSVVVSWPVSVSTLFGLQQSTNLNAAWSNVSVTPQIVNSNNQVTLTPGSSAAFYRLSLP